MGKCLKQFMEYLAVPPCWILSQALSCCFLRSVVRLPVPYVCFRLVPRRAATWLSMLMRKHAGVRELLGAMGVTVSWILRIALALITFSVPMTNKTSSRSTWIWVSLLIYLVGYGNSQHLCGPARSPARNYSVLQPPGNRQLSRFIRT